MKQKLILLFVCGIFINSIRSEGQIGTRWYSYSEYVANTVGSFDYTGLELWNDTTGLYGYVSLGTPGYFINNFTSVGLSFAPVLTAWNDPTLYGCGGTKYQQSPNR